MRTGKYCFTKKALHISKFGVILDAIARHSTSETKQGISQLIQIRRASTKAMSF